MDSTNAVMKTGTVRTFHFTVLYLYYPLLCFICGDADTMSICRDSNRALPQRNLFLIYLYVNILSWLCAKDDYIPLMLSLCFP